jgi:hypothetical protein
MIEDLPPEAIVGVLLVALYAYVFWLFYNE